MADHGEQGRHGQHSGHGQHGEHGHSVAAWTAVVIILVGAAVACFAVIVPSLFLGIVGAGIMVLGAVAGKVLSMAGYGQAKPNKPQGTTVIR
ncbi:MAG TPA: HGxxPAAW family protein [Dermatophilaceae bacterium]|nr:HGxxPAAW family protein [Dermatophilaceae bacterium]